MERNTCPNGRKLILEFIFNGSTFEYGQWNKGNNGNGRNKANNQNKHDNVKDKK